MAARVKNVFVSTRIFSPLSVVGAISSLFSATSATFTTTTITNSIKNSSTANDANSNSTVPMCPPVERWIKDYCSLHRILLVGEGDFSFSSSLAKAFGCASTMAATSLDSKGIKFDRIIFNFPFAGFFKQLSRECQLRSLVSEFLENAKVMISENGEIHITHKTNAFHLEWNLEDIASSHGLRLIEVVTFDHRDYPGYNTKRGFGGEVTTISIATQAKSTNLYSNVET
ncbi:hypothetical protein BUALT_Bualt09G0105500 [Buddleja alternifolia]|uniref:25S rRNA (uridine-N(3))-methyltransferase BMT5-like domain-containing protein n=1 Tax=Buddleja alternifolia TaxID=168488 RepID=A0AAV6XCB5_9LAMI|nr:hypothetical protein BUALT_Bualt09G0105500 [Buddleja alternifolia]